MFSKKTKTQIGWSVWIASETADDPQHQWKHSVYFAPEPMTHLVVKEKDAHYTKCPAVVDYFQNVFLIRCPYDITVNYNDKEQYLHVDGMDQEFFDHNIMVRYNDYGPNNYPLLTIRIEYLFVADQDVVIESLPVSLFTTPLLQNTMLVPGTFNIHKWPRPLDFTFEIIDQSKPLVFKRGDPLFAVRFRANNNVELTRIDISSQLRQTVESLLKSRKAVSGKNLAARYEMAKNWLFGRKWLS